MMTAIESFHFLRPMWLIAIAPTLLIWWLLLRATDPRMGMASSIASHLLDRLVMRPKNRTRFNPINLLLPLWLITVIAIAGPSFRKEKSPFADDRAALVLVVKMTDSMLTDDLKPTRLQRVRYKVHDLSELRTGSATGLVVYSGTAHLVMPITDDSSVIDHMLEAVEPKIMPNPGDSLYDAIEIAERQINKNLSGGSILVVTDGVEQGQLPRLKEFRDRSASPIQFFVPIAEETSLERTGIDQAAEILKARIVRISPDARDIGSLARRTNRTTAQRQDTTRERWRDDGYFLLPIIALGMLFWSRRGWTVHWD